jgi:hypothetical protein
MKIRQLAVLCLLTSVLCLHSQAAGMSSVHSLESGSIAITNTQKRSAWHPVAILFRFDAPVTATLTVARQTAGTTFQLATIDLSGNQYAVWVPEAPITFHLGDVLAVTSTATNGTAEIIRKGE